MILISLDDGQFVDGVFIGSDRFLNRIITTPANKNLTLNRTKTKIAPGANQLMDLSNALVVFHHVSKFEVSFEVRTKPLMTSEIQLMTVCRVFNPKNWFS